MPIFTLADLTPDDCTNTHDQELMEQNWSYSLKGEYSILNPSVRLRTPGVAVMS